MDNPITLTNLSAHYGAHLALDQITLAAPLGRVTALVGANGSGKSTVLMALAGLLRPTHGSISGLPSNVAFVPQRSSAPDHLPITVRQVVAMGRWSALGLFARLGSDDQRIVDDCLAQLRIDDLASRRLGSLSGGQRQRALVAQGLAQRADLLLLDEPLAGIDARASEDITLAIDSERSRGATIVMATHERTQAARADHVVHLCQGALAFR
ncbi:zinc ABC transporter ATP-binding protein AztA [Brevibacterium sp. UCMA 11754]|uniref:zinc ABC transporter ATP-binding protein AztA n=1 Tax=Brevibacterium sp. UCMA 11754 TaxID=2749198 RepID=UPI001F2AF5DB|nr:zinc ABC transporter ATP-binding protein AztA [Brevibacterium sp. UCMA 11754]MCF2572035.1 metal ABC transporter ATP-binding protein [Brevibacterium sp. UCMA 11754]MCF2572036.1 metal ABC transporter ATP-binding protein [Brevibacterium sp. UCMA 11754]MCF2573360.1 metal ABC transporter ATP-binding protein [Brevibacterium sp. UCMA 11754]